jgi:Tol biopolymer transport system component
MNCEGQNGVTQESAAGGGRQRLESWKEIGAYLQRDARTARNWEKEEGLPVHRHAHKSRSSVYAYPTEIDAWRAGRGVASEPTPKLFWRWPALAATMLLCLVMVGNGIRPTVASAQARQTSREIWSGQGASTAGSVSLDGRYLSFLSGPDVGIRDLTTGKDRLLPRKTFGPLLFSPDGRQAAYPYCGNPCATLELRILRLDDPGAPPKTAHQSEDTLYIQAVGWTPDSKKVLVKRTLRSDRNSQIAVISIQDSSLQVLKSFGWRSAGQTSLSPDGRWIAFDAPARDKEAAHDIFVLAMDGSRETKVVESAAIDWAPVWSPDGSQILFLSDRTGSASLWSVAVDQGRPVGSARLLKPDTGFINPLGMTRSGTLYYLSESWGRRNVHTADLDAGLDANKAPRLASEQFVNTNAAASWSPDGQYLAYYARFAPTAEMSGITRLVIRNATTGEEREVRMRELRIPPYTTASPKWFPDGRSVLVASWDQQQPVVGFYRVSVLDGKAERLHNTITAVGWGVGQFDISPDGRSIVYADMKSTDDPQAPLLPQLMRFDLDQRRDTLLTPGFPITAVAVSPDGKEVAYSSFVPGFMPVIMTIPLAGGEPRLVHKLAGFTANSTPLAWSPDQRHLIIAQQDKAEATSSWSLWKVPVTGGTPEKMATSASRIGAVALRPDGRQVAFTTLEDTTQAVWALENFLPKSPAAKQ